MDELIHWLLEQEEINRTQAHKLRNENPVQAGVRRLESFVQYEILRKIKELYYPNEDWRTFLEKCS